MQCSLLFIPKCFTKATIQPRFIVQDYKNSEALSVFFEKDPDEGLV